MTKKPLILGLALAAFTAIGLSVTTPASAQGWHCIDTYVLLNGRCPDPCSHGELCPCVTCVPINPE
jgi:hypothetical protein